MPDRSLQILRSNRTLIVRRPGPQGPPGPPGESSAALGGVITSFLMHCADTGTNHRVQLFPDASGKLSLIPDQTPEDGDAMTSFVMRAPDETDHLVVLRQVRGFLTLLVDQDPL